MNVLNRSTGEGTLLTPPPDAYFTKEALDEWARDTNGAPFSQETKEELQEFMDVTEDGCLTCVAFSFELELGEFTFRSFKGFLQIYQLQTENDEEETWRDLVSRSQLVRLLVSE